MIDGRYALRYNDDGNEGCNDDKTETGGKRDEDI